MLLARATVSAGGRLRAGPDCGKCPRCYGSRVTWLPVDEHAPSERDATLGLHAEVYALHRELLRATAAATDAELLELSKARMAQLFRCREELALHSPERLTELESWDHSPAFTARERAALAFVEQFVVDPTLISPELAGELERELGTSGVINFTTALTAHEASLRLATLLDLAPAAR